MPQAAKNCKGWHDISTEIQESTSAQDLVDRVLAWPGGFFTGRADRIAPQPTIDAQKYKEEQDKLDQASQEKARKAAQENARNAADAWCKTRSGCDDKLLCRCADFKFFCETVYVAGLDEFVAYLSIEKIKCDCQPVVINGNGEH